MDVRVMLPMLRAEAAEVAVEFLAMAAAENAIAVTRWVVLNWGADAGLRGAAHPSHAAALERSSPAWKLADARDALDTACWRYRLSTGYDGLALARQHIVHRYGTVVADYTLKPLVDAATAGAWLDDLLMQDGPEPLPPEPEPTPTQRRASAAAMAEWSLSLPEMDDLGRRLGALLAACAADSGAQPSLVTVDALAAVRVAIGAALCRGFDVAGMQAVLDTWTAATGGPQITVADKT